MSRPRTANPGTYDNNKIVQDEDGELKKPPKRKKSVHFPDNPVIPIDDSSYENSQGQASPMDKNLNVSGKSIYIYIIIHPLFYPIFRRFNGA